MYEEEPTYHDVLDTVENLIAARQHSPTFWDADAAEQAHVDPWEHPSWDVADALAEDGWDDPATAAEVLDQAVIEDARLVPLADTPFGRPDYQPLALVPVDTDGHWPADHGDDQDPEVRAA